MNKKFLITADMRDLEKKLNLGEISYSKMIEILNEKAFYHYIDFLNENLHLAYRKGEIGQTLYLEDGSVLLPKNYEGIEY